MSVEELNKMMKESSIFLDGYEAGYKTASAAPVRTKDLTDEEIAAIVDNCTSDDNGYDIWCDGHAVARAVIAADREKNK